MSETATREQVVEQASKVKGMPCRAALECLADRDAAWMARMDGETDRKWAARLLQAAVNLV